VRKKPIKQDDRTDTLCDNNKNYLCPINQEGRNRTCRLDGFCPMSGEEGDNGC